jgi:hypothetical protein
MAYIDKTWCQSLFEFDEFKHWAINNKFKTPYGEIIDFTYCMYSFDKTPEELIEELKRCKSILVMNTSMVEDYYLIKYCDIPFVQSRMKDVYSEEYYESIKNGTSEFDTFDRDSIAGTRVKCILESEFGKKDFLYKRKGRKFVVDYWIEVTNKEHWLSYNEQFDHWVIYDKELMNNDSSVCHKPIKSRKALIRQIKKWRLPKGSIVRWVGCYSWDQMKFKVY